MSSYLLTIVSPLSTVGTLQSISRITSLISVSFPDRALGCSPPLRGSWIVGHPSRMGGNPDSSFFSFNDGGPLLISGPSPCHRVDPNLHPVMGLEKEGGTLGETPKTNRYVLTFGLHSLLGLTTVNRVSPTGEPRVSFRFSPFIT